MKSEDIVHAIAAAGGTNVMTAVASRALQYDPFRGLLVHYMDKRTMGAVENSQRPGRPRRIAEDKRDLVLGLVHSLDRAFNTRHLSKAATRGLLHSLTLNVLLRGGREAAVREFKAGHGGLGPPFFLTIGPGKACNLRCVGCYASSADGSEKLDWDVFERIIDEAKCLWGVRFFVITGGEPLCYRSQGKDFLEMASRHADCYFLMYTNGTLIDRRMAARMAEVGNITPAISVEGFEERTDERRGKGVFQRVLGAMANLREAGVPFGISLTATRLNCEEILSDEFLDFFFEEQGAVYGWVFQYMPIGRSFTLGLLPTAEQRAWMWQRTWQVVRERRIFLADFWNLGTASDGCIAAGRQGGYLYVDWNGSVMPCVFVPYSPVNVNDLYQNGGTLNDVWDHPFFGNIRAWQREYGYGHTEPGNVGNWLMPCINRDHHRTFWRMLTIHEPDPEDAAAAQAWQDESYHRGLMAYNEQVAALMDPIWEKEYLEKP
jgi:MoaA/NifB/PqqE/SkfB family radical SAM enzyme